MPLEPGFWHYAAELHTLSVTYLLFGLALTDTTDNLSEMCPLELTDFCPFLYHRTYTILQGPIFPQWLSQVVMTGAQTGYPQLGEPARSTPILPNLWLPKFQKNGAPIIPNLFPPELFSQKLSIKFNFVTI